MSLAAVALKETSLQDALDDAVNSGIIDTAQFVGRRVRVSGGNYVLETTISGVQIAVWIPGKIEKLVLKNVRFTLKNSVVSISKKRYQVNRTIDHLSYAYGWANSNRKVNSSDMKVVFKDDGMETIKWASMDILD